MAEKILSVSIAAYNIEKYIQETVGSLLNEEIIDKIEILVVSDGSTDNTVKLGKQFADMYPNTVRVIEKENGGWGSTVNWGIMNATGKYFKLIDGDDQAAIENLPEFIKYLEENNYDLVLTPYIEFVDETGEMKGKVSHGQFARRGISASDIPENVSLNMHECCFKTSLLKENNIKITEKCFYTDVEFVIRGLSVTKSIGYLDKIIYKYRVARAEQSMSINGFRKHYRDHLKMTYNMLEFEKNYSGNDKVKKVIQNRLKKVVMMQYNIFCFLEGNKEHKREIMQFDRKLKQEYIGYYKVPMKKVMILRYSHFMLYKVLCSFCYKKELHK